VSGFFDFGTAPAALISVADLFVAAQQQPSGKKSRAAPNFGHIYDVWRSIVGLNCS
jgi:hypothetical protein